MLKVEGFLEFWKVLRLRIDFRSFCGQIAKKDLKKSKKSKTSTIQYYQIHLH